MHGAFVSAVALSSVETWRFSGYLFVLKLRWDVALVFFEIIYHVNRFDNLLFLVLVALNIEVLPHNQLSVQAGEKDLVEQVIFHVHKNR
jgi:hypothetical protein